MDLRSSAERLCDAETWKSRAKAIPSVEWRATPEQVERFRNAHHSVGAIYDASVVAFYRKVDIPVPPPRSVYHWESLFDDQFFNYWSDIKIQWDEQAYKQAYLKTKELFSGIKDLEMVSLDDVSSEILNTDKRFKSSGMPLFQQKGLVLPEEMSRAKAIASGRVAPPIAVAYHRTQIGKTRLVWGLPLAQVLLEGRFMVPITKAMRKARTPYLMGCTTLGITGRLNKLSFSSVQYCLDWSKFDSTVPHRVIHSMFHIVKGWFRRIDESLFEQITRYFCTCPILMPDMRVYKGRRRGVPSGSWFTQLIDSLCNCFLSHYISFRLHERIADCVFLGDDAVLAMDVMPTLKDWDREAALIGMRVQPLKQVVTHGSPHFLAHNWGGVWPTRSREESLQRFATHERFVRLPKEELFQYRIARAKAYLIDNPEIYDIIISYIQFLVHYHSKLDVQAALVFTEMSAGPGVKVALMRNPDNPDYGKSNEGSTVGELVLRH